MKSLSSRVSCAALGLLSMYCSSKALAQEVCCCFVTENTSACYIAGMGADCGSYSCPHIIIVSQAMKRCVGAVIRITVDLRARRSRQQRQLPTEIAPRAHGSTAARISGLTMCQHLGYFTCQKRHSACSLPHGCIDTGVVFTSNHLSKEAVGEGC